MLLVLGLLFATLFVLLYVTAKQKYWLRNEAAFFALQYSSLITMMIGTFHVVIHHPVILAYVFIAGFAFGGVCTWKDEIREFFRIQMPKILPL
jgi:hypothetical protein